MIRALVLVGVAVAIACGGKSNGDRAYYSSCPGSQQDTQVTATLTLDCVNSLFGRPVPLPDLGSRFRNPVFTFIPAERADLLVTFYSRRDEGRGTYAEFNIRGQGSRGAPVAQPELTEIASIRVERGNELTDGRESGRVVWFWRLNGEGFELIVPSDLSREQGRKIVTDLISKLIARDGETITAG